MPDDARAQRSLEALRAALLELVAAKPFEQISIKEITQAAGLTYPTFFRRFAGKEELLTEIATEEVRRVLALSTEAIGPDSVGSIEPLCSYISANRKLWRTLLTGGAIAPMREEFMRSSREISAGRPRTNPWLPLDLAVPFIANGIFEILSWWMRQPDSYPVENVVTLFNALIIDLASRPRIINML